MSQTLSQPDLLSSQTVSGPSRVVFEIKGIVPSFKTQKTAYGWKDKKTGKIFARPATLPEHKEWMRKTVHDFGLQFFSAFQIGKPATLTAATLRSLIASLPYDDSWRYLPETVLKSELCEPGKEGATVILERL